MVDHLDYLNLDIVRYRKGTRWLELRLRGAYIEFLTMIYENGGQLADNEQRNAYTMNISVRLYRAMRNELIRSGRLVLENGIIMDEAANEIIEKIDARRKNRRNNLANIDPDTQQNYEFDNESLTTHQRTDNEPSTSRQRTDNDSLTKKSKNGGKQGKKIENVPAPAHAPTRGNTRGKFKKNISPPSTSPSGTSPPTASNTKGTQVDNVDWPSVEAKMLSEANRIAGLDAEQASDELESMKDWARAQGIVRKDWIAQWRNWLRKDYRNEKTKRQTSPSKPSKEQLIGEAAAYAKQLAARRRGG